MDRRTALAALATLAAGSLLPPAVAAADRAPDTVRLSDEAWRKRLSPEAYDVLRHGGTEPPGSSPLEAEERPGLYRCAGCDLALFSSATKFHSGTGWPSFYAPLKNAVATSRDTQLVVPRTEVHCRRCEGHLGHVFDDGPRPTGLRYCLDGVALRFVPGRA